MRASIRLHRFRAAWLAAATALCALLLPVFSSSYHEALTAEPQDEQPQDRAADKKRVKETLARFLADWEQSDDRDRAAMARFFGFFNFPDALDTLRKEAASGTGEAAVASLEALAAMGDVSSIELFREALRRSVNPEAVAISAAVIGDWKDDFSYSLLILSLLRPPCEGRCVVAIAEAATRLRHPYFATLLQYIALTTQSPTVRLALAALLAQRKGTVNRPHYERILQEAVESGPPVAGLSAAEQEELAVLALWGWARASDSSCPPARDLMVRRFRAATGSDRAVIARDILLADLPCLGRDRAEDRALRKELVAQLDDPALADQPSSVSGLPVLPDDTLDPPWVDWLVQLTGHFAGFSEVLSAAEFAQTVERLERVRRTENAASPSRYLPVDRSVRVPRGDVPALERAAGSWAPPEGFDGYPFTPGQPDWWPEHLEITIDDGPRQSRDAEILAALNKWGVKVTFFYIGASIAHFYVQDARAAVSSVTAVLDSGHRIQFHSMYHDTKYARHLLSWEPSQIADDVHAWNQVMTALLGRSYTATIGRSPGGMGRELKHLDQGFYLGGLGKPVLWRIQDPQWGPGTSAAALRDLADNLLASPKPTIILLHEYTNVPRQLDIFISRVYDRTHEKK